MREPYRAWGSLVRTKYHHNNPFTRNASQVYFQELPGWNALNKFRKEISSCRCFLVRTKYCHDNPFTSQLKSICQKFQEKGSWKVLLNLPALVNGAQGLLGGNAPDCFCKDCSSWRCCLGKDAVTTAFSLQPHLWSTSGEFQGGWSRTNSGRNCWTSQHWWRKRHSKPEKCQGKLPRWRCLPQTDWSLLMDWGAWTCHPGKHLMPSWLGHESVSVRWSRWFPPYDFSAFCRQTVQKNE